MKLYNFQFFTNGRIEAHLIRSPRAGNEKGPAAQVVRDPVPAYVALFEYRRSSQLTRNEWLRSRRDEEPINPTRELVTRHKKPGPVSGILSATTCPFRCRGDATA